MKIAQRQHYAGDDWWEWSVWIDATRKELDGIESVTWHLHPTFVPRDVRIQDRRSKFAFETAGWGTFEIRATVLLKDQKKRTLSHELELTYPDGSPAQA